MLINEINHFQGLAKKNFEDHGEIVPVMFGVYRDFNTGKYTKKIIGLVFNDQSDKEALTSFIIEEIRNNNLREYLLILESWITQIGENKFDRTECVMMVYGSVNEEKVFMSTISRNPDSLGKWESYDTRNMQGRFLGLFKTAVAQWN